MSRKINPIRVALSALPVIALAAFAVPAIDLVASPTAAVAGGKGKDNGRGHDGHAGQEHDRGYGHGKDYGRGQVASELGGLNAAHASQTARDNASPNSQVGKIEAYREAMEEEMELGATLEEAHEAVAQDFEDALEGISDLSEAAVAELGGLLGLTDD